MVTNETRELIQDNLSIKEYGSAIALKEKIRTMIASRGLEHLELYGMKSIGANLCLTFISQPADLAAKS